MFDFNGDGKVDSQEMMTGIYIFDQINKDDSSGGRGGGNRGGKGDGNGCLVALVIVLVLFSIIEACVS